MADLDIAEDLGARADQHATGDLRMAIGALLACAAERDAVQDRDVIADDGGFADDEARRVIEEDAAADACGRVDIGLEDAGGAALQVERQITAAPASRRTWASKA